MWLDRGMEATTSTTGLHGLSESDAAELVKGSSFARRVKATDREHGSRLCDHGRLHFQHCKFCAAGVPAVCDLTVEEMRANAREWLD